MTAPLWSVTVPDMVEKIACDQAREHTSNPPATVSRNPATRFIIDLRSCFIRVGNLDKGVVPHFLESKKPVDQGHFLRSYPLSYSTPATLPTVLRRTADISH